MGGSYSGVPAGRAGSEQHPLRNACPARPARRDRRRGLTSRQRSFSTNGTHRWTTAAGSSNDTPPPRAGAAQWATVSRSRSRAPRQRHTQRHGDRILRNMLKFLLTRLSLTSDGRLRFAETETATPSETGRFTRSPNALNLKTETGRQAGTWLPNSLKLKQKGREYHSRPCVLTNRQWRRVESRDWLPDQHGVRNCFVAETGNLENSRG